MHASIFFILLLPCFASDLNKPWENNVELGLVASEGNAQSESWGFSNVFEMNFSSGELEMKMSAIQVEATRFQRRALGTAEEWELEETSEQIKTAENYRMALKYNFTLGERAYCYSAGEWASNKISGIRSRTSVSAGLGHKWRNDERLGFKTDYGMQYTRERAIFQPTNFRGEFASVRLGYSLFGQVSKSSRFKQELKAETSLEDHNDFLAVLTNQLKVAINDHLALKVGGEFRFDNEPAFIKIPLFEQDSSPTASGAVPLQKEELDSTLTTSLIINF